MEGEAGGRANTTAAGLLVPHHSATLCLHFWQQSQDGVPNLEEVGVPLSHPLTGWDENSPRLVTPDIYIYIYTTQCQELVPS